MTISRTLFRNTAFTLFTLVTLTARADLAILQYHHVSDSTPPATTTSTSLFDAQLALIRQLDLEVVPLEQGTRAALNGELEDRQQVALTFDDAYLSVLQEAAPRLREYGFPYTVFVNTGAIGQSGYMSWDQLETLAAEPGVTIANHSEDHGHLARRPEESEQHWQQRISRSLDQARQTLEQRLGETAPLFAYPYGEFDQGLQRAVADRGWLGFGQHSGPVGSTSSATRLPRFPMANAYGQLNSLEHKLTSRALPVTASNLPDSVIDQNPPLLTFTLAEPLDAGRLSCFASGQGRIDHTREEQGLIAVQAPKAVNSRRFRYNCTLPDGNGRYYWLSQPWLDLGQPED